MAYQPIPKFQDRAIGWLLESIDNMLALLEIVVPDIAKDLEVGSLKTIESSLISDDFRKIEEDMVYEAKLQSQMGGSVAFVVIVAHQSKKDSMMSFRLLNAMVKLWERELRTQSEKRVKAPARRLRPVVPIIISTYQNPWRVPRLRDVVPSHSALMSFLPDFELAVLDLASIAREDIIKHQRPLAYILGLFKAEKQKEGFDQLFKEALAKLKELSSSEESLKALVWFCVQFAWHRRPEAEWQRLAKMVSEVVGEKEGTLMEKTFITMADRVKKEGREVGRKEGIKEGIREGRKEGELTGQRKTLLKLLCKKFPNQSEQTISLELEKIKDLGRLSALTDRIFENLAWDEFWKV